MSDRDMEAEFMAAMKQLPREEQGAFIQLMEWIAQRPDDAEPLTREMMDELLEDIRRERRRRLLGGKVGQILPFKKPGKDEDQED